MLHTFDVEEEELVEDSSHVADLEMRNALSDESENKEIVIEESFMHLGQEKDNHS